MQTNHPMPDNFYRHFETDCVTLWWWNKTPLCAQWLRYPNRHAFWQWKTTHRGKAWLRTQS